jgi:hypothetical protein
LDRLHFPLHSYYHVDSRSPPHFEAFQKSEQKRSFDFAEQSNDSIFDIIVCFGHHAHDDDSKICPRRVLRLAFLAGTTKTCGYK